MRAKRRIYTLLRKITCFTIACALLCCCLFTIGGCVKEANGADMNLVSQGLRGSPNMPNTTASQLKVAWEKGLLVIDLKPGQSESDFTWENAMTDISIYNPPQFTQESIDDYLKLSAYYQKALDVYMLKAIRLDLLDQQLKDADIGFVAVPPERRSVFQDQTTLEIETLYVRVAECHIERMSIEEISLLRQLFFENKTEITDQAIELVSKTMHEVIRQYDYQGLPYADDVTVNFPGSSAQIGYNPNAIIIAFPNCEVYTEDGRLTGEQEDLFFQRTDYLIKHLPEVQIKAENTLNMPVMFIITEGTLLNSPENEYVTFTISSRGVIPEPQSRK